MSSALLTEICQWKLDARFERSERYFYHKAEIEELLAGHKCFVIGRKGSGKTAIAHHLQTLQDYQTFSKRLTFKNYPWRDLLKQRNLSFNPPNQYVSFWKAIVYAAVLRMMTANENIQGRVRHQLERLFPPDPLKNLTRNVHSWRNLTLKLNLLGADATLAGEQRTEPDDSTWTDRIDSMEEAIRKYIDGSRYIITFDELDEGFVSTPKGWSNYEHLITGLFKAALDIRASFANEPHIKVHPVVFLRDDIYDRLIDPDKTKWRDFGISLRWDPEAIRRLLAFRISRAMSEAGPILVFQDAWLQVFGRGLASFRSILLRSLLRPRDFVAFLQLAASHSLRSPVTRVTSASFDAIEGPYSEHMYSELVDEIEGSLSGVRGILGILQDIGRREFSIDEFAVRHVTAILQGSVSPSLPARTVLDTLFYFSVVGRLSETGPPIWHYKDERAGLRDDRNVVVHPCLHAALRLRRRS